jgi:hypothetical protein
MSSSGSAFILLRRFVSFLTVASAIAACASTTGKRSAPITVASERHREAQRFEQHCDQLAARLRHALGEYRSASRERKRDVARLLLMITGPTLYACGAAPATLRAVARCYAEHSDCIVEQTAQAARDIAARTHRPRWSIERGAAAHREHCQDGKGWATDVAQALHSARVGARMQTATWLIRTTYNTCSEERVPVGQLDRCYVEGDYGCVLRLGAQWQRGS